ncbi:hypothetical protein C8J56DRAFT_927067 [Mycena floridula]|nr:hypothetical protein C8J56DRAFT_927067 [Mycena floridula]
MSDNKRAGVRRSAASSNADASSSKLSSWKARSIIRVQESIKKVVSMTSAVLTCPDGRKSRRSLILQNNHETDANKTFMALRKCLSQAEFEEVKQYFGFQGGDENPFEGWEDINVSEVLLPSSVDNELCERTIQSFMSPGSLNEAATGMLSAGAFQTLLCLFGGILRDQPDSGIPAADLNRGGKIEREIFCRDELLFFVRQLEPKDQLRKHLPKFLAQLLCEVFAVWQLNRQQNWYVDKDELIPAQACLCDTMDAYFVSYDGKRFTRRIFRYDGVWSGNGPMKTREMEKYALHALAVHQFTFAMLLEGYCKAVGLYYERPGSLTLIYGYSFIRQTTFDNWYDALKHADNSRAASQRAHKLKSDALAENGLKFLHESLESWPPAAKVSDRLLLPSTVKSMSERLMNIHQQGFELNWEAEHLMLPSQPDQIRRKMAVDSFWKQTPKILETAFRPAIEKGGHDGFEALKYMAGTPEHEVLHHEVLERFAEPFMVSSFLGQLKISQKQHHWSGR